MSSLSFSTYLISLIKNAHKQQYTNIVTGAITKPKFIIGGYKWIFVGGGLFTLLTNVDINKDILTTLITSLSILIGLLANFLIASYAQSDKLSAENIYSDTEISLFNKKVRFFKQFNTLNAYAILLSIVTLLLCLINLFWPENEINLLDNFFKCRFSLEIEDIIQTGINSIILLSKGTLVYFILDLLYIVIYSVSSFSNYYKGEMDDRIIPDN